ncbi:MAG: Beta-galactosidase C-terminal domain, partial [Vallitaleaceae bacterium]|nr:Beta-galactosidase C-terminal domain [Vallitaleaceae bacterium]
YLFSAVEVNEHWNNRTQFSMKVAGKLNDRQVLGEASVWAGDIELNGGTTLLTFNDSDYAGQPVITEKQTGEGTAIYAAAVGLDDTLMELLFDYSLGKAGIAFNKGVPEHVEVIRRGNYTFVINHLNEAVKVQLEGQYKAILGEISHKDVELKPYGVVILERLLR